MKCTFCDKITLVETNTYSLALAVPPAPSFLKDKRTNRLFGFVAGGDCSKVQVDWENNVADAPWRAKENADGSWELRRTEKSSQWTGKAFVIRAEEEAICCWHELQGEGDLDEVRYFRACYEENEFGFAGDFDEVWSAAPNFREQCWYHPTARVIITNGNDLSMCSGCTAIANVPDIMALHDRRDKALLGTAIFAKQGEYLWDDMVWNPTVKRPATYYEGDHTLAGGFAVRYCGKKHIAGQWTSPYLLLSFPAEVSQAIPCALEYAYRANWLPRPNPMHQGPAWWQKPIYCTWHDQTSRAAGHNIDYHKPMEEPADFCTQALTEEWLQALIDHDAKPGIVILDAKWQKSLLDCEPDLKKWPDMRGWIDRCHERGIKVFLWTLAWHKEDMPVEEAITRDGKPVCGDITNPLYEKRLRRQLHRFFSSEPGCLNADGLKIDGMMELPTGPGLKNQKNIWGLELQRYWLNIVYDEAKRAKKETCISTFAANPYLDEFTDMLRLADMYTYRLSTEDSMRWRKDLFNCTNPGVPVDTDGQLDFCYDPDYLHLLDVEKELGIPTLYNAKFLRRNHYFFLPEYRTFTEQDYQKIAQVFRDYTKTL